GAALLTRRGRPAGNGTQARRAVDRDLAGAGNRRLAAPPVPPLRLVPPQGAVPGVRRHAPAPARTGAPGTRPGRRLRGLLRTVSCRPEFCAPRFLLLSAGLAPGGAGRGPWYGWHRVRRSRAASRARLGAALPGDIARGGR